MTGLMSDRPGRYSHGRSEVHDQRPQEYRSAMTGSGSFAISEVIQVWCFESLAVMQLAGA